jgi:hypothetical protein
MNGFSGKKMSISHLLEERKSLKNIIPDLTIVKENPNEKKQNINVSIPMSYKKYICGIKRVYPSGNVPFPSIEINNKMRDSVILHRKIIRDLIYDLNNLQKIPVSELSDEILSIRTKLSNFIEDDNESLILDSDEDEEGRKDEDEEEEENEDDDDLKNILLSDYDDDFIKEGSFPSNHLFKEDIPKAIPFTKYMSVNKKIKIDEELSNLERACMI